MIRFARRHRTGPRGELPLALVYRGPAARPDGCAEAVADLLARSGHGLDVRYVGPREELALSAATLARATLYAQPGGGSLGPAYRRMRRHRSTIRAFVHDGGHYLGFCLGAYLAGRTPGFGLFPGDTDRWIDGPGATVTDDGDALVRVDWRGRERTLFFQDGPRFLLDRTSDVDVLARYPDGAVAALAAPCGSGRVGLVGPHPEATADWFTDAGLPVVDARDAGRQLVDAFLHPAAPEEAP